MRLFTFLLSLLSIITLAQDGINYQGVATNGSGAELVNQNISIKASIISDSATGSVQWQETHATTTDQFGLFNVVIGQGSSTGVGQTTNFDNMSWGSGNHYLRIEMDATGGSNYTLFGTSQLMSVPYALYAKSAGIDSIMLANMIGTSAGGGGCELMYPDGFSNLQVVNLDIILSTNYTVPAGKTLYITNLFISNIKLFIDGQEIAEGNLNSNSGDAQTLSIPILVKSGSTLSSNGNASSSDEIQLNGFLVDENVEVINLDLIQSNNYTIPIGKILYITNIYLRNTKLFIDGQVIAEGQFNSNSGDSKPLSNQIIVASGSILSSNTSSSDKIQINGYLVDENYFSNCGGGGNSSSASAVDSAMVAGMISNALINNTGSSIPIGTIQAYSGTTPPNGWLLCDGSTISRSTYSVLFSVIDTIYGIGDGSYTLQWIDSNNDGIMQPGEMINVMSTFNLPDLRGRTIIGTDNMGGTSANVVNGASYLGIIGGSETHTLTVAEMPNHNHSFFAVGSQGTGNHNDGQTYGNTIGNTFITTSSEGGDQPHNNMQPYISLNYIIKY
ncbi:tail fiber protein [Bacteroidota bacterium]|nr:tail fiber protein [Bacteroidota bacterium]